jgi:flagellar biosynthetic protein FliP
MPKNILLLVCMWAFSPDVFASSGIHIDIGESDIEQVGSAFKIMALFTAVSLTPAILLTTTSFLRILIVMSFLRTALGTQGIPPTQAIIALSLFMSIAVMSPVFTETYDKGIKPYLDGKAKIMQSMTDSVIPLKKFMLKHVKEKDVALFYDATHTEKPSSSEEISLKLLIPAFVVSELTTAFEMSVMIFLPFVLIDLLVASVLMGLGMAMLPPMMVAMPIKVAVFVLSDGWNVMASALIRSFA